MKAKILTDLFFVLFRGILLRDRQLLFEIGEKADMVQVKLQNEAGSNYEKSLAFLAGYADAVAEIAYTLRDHTLTQEDNHLLRRKYTIKILKKVEQSINQSQAIICKSLGVKYSNLNELFQKLIDADFLRIDRRGIEHFLILSAKGALALEIEREQGRLQSWAPRRLGMDELNATLKDWKPTETR